MKALTLTALVLALTSTLAHSESPLATSASSSPSAGDRIVAAAQSMVGKYPYSWGGGDDNGPTLGTKEASSPYCDDSAVVGFDCSGLAKYAVYQGTGTSLYHKAQVQYDNAPRKVPLADKRPGDLVFYGASASASSIYHVAIYAGNDTIIDAPGHNDDCTGKLVRQVKLYTSNLLPDAGRYWNESGSDSSSSSSENGSSNNKMKIGKSFIALVLFTLFFFV